MKLDQISVIDTDTHVTEPPDLWTSRLAKKWGDQIPQVVWNEEFSEPRWRIAGRSVAAEGLFSTAGWKEHLPSYPPTLEEADPASFDPHQRLQRMDEYGIHTQLLYPNLMAFFTSLFMELGAELSLECVRAYNDFLTDFCAADPQRLVALTALPFWDLEASVLEMQRCKENGHKGVLFSAIFERIGMPNLPDPHWHPILDAAQSMEQSINFHIGFAQTTSDQIETLKDPRKQDRTDIAEISVLGFLSNVRAMMMLMLHGVCDRYPRARFVSVESGAGYIPFVLQAADWQFENSGVRVDHPDWLRPSEYFRRQIFGTFWFEQVAPQLLEDFQDNLMFETDFPHPTSLSPGPNSTSLPASQMIERNLAGTTDGVLQKVLHDNAARLYHLD